jgi:hypothetical protein
MDRNLTSHNSVDTFHNTLEELHTLISDLETQIKSESSLSQIEMKSVEETPSESQFFEHEVGFSSPILEDGFYLED